MLGGKKNVRKWVTVSYNSQALIQSVIAHINYLFNKNCNLIPSYRNRLCRSELEWTGSRADPTVDFRDDGNKQWVCTTAGTAPSSYMLGLFSTVLNFYDNIMSNGRMISEYWKWCVRNSLLPNLKFYASICLERPRKTTVNPQLRQDSTAELLNTKQKCLPLDYEVLTYNSN